jgi:hypothetical protein
MVAAMITRCSQQRMHTTHDAVSEAAARKLVVGVLPGEMQMSCSCGRGECKPQECAAVYANDAAGNHAATFHGKGLGALRMSDGNVCVYRMPQTQDSRNIPLTLHSLNELHREFYRRGDQ